MIVVNKWDTIPDKNQHTVKYYEQDVREKLRMLNWAPVVYSTAIAGHSVDKYFLIPSPPLLNFVYFFSTTSMLPTSSSAYAKRLF